MVLLEQISALLNFIESHQDLAFGHCSRTTEGRSQSKRYWTECAHILNTVSVDCPKKTQAEWRTFFNEYKSKMLKKVKANKKELSAKGGVPAKNFCLTPLQQRLYSILRRDVGETLPGVQHNPVTLGTGSHRSSGFPHTPSSGPASKPTRHHYGTRRNPVEDKDNEALAAVQSRLEAIEAKNVEACLQQAQATNNLAAAINRLSSVAEKIVDLIGDIVAERDYRIPSGSEE